MEIPKNQNDLIKLLIEQDKKIESMRKAIMRLEQRLQKTAMLTEKVRYATKKQGDKTNNIISHLRENLPGYRDG